jgi:phosphohistidine swiveling domain-containing protein
LKKLNISSKAKTLELLKDNIDNSKILPLYRFTINDFNSNTETIISNILDIFDCKLIIRSSSQKEDSDISSLAGMFESVLNIEPNKDDIYKGICSVIDSYKDYIDDNDEVFVQPMLDNISMSGVIFSADIDTLAPYYTINYDTSGSTTSVTSGNSNKLSTMIVYKHYKDIKDQKIATLINATKECEDIFDNQFLDIEFAYSNNQLYILQVRPIVKKSQDFSGIDIGNSLHKIYKKIKKLNAPHPRLIGDNTIFGVMPDWNPAEIIGVKPKKLAISMYKELITDEIWAYQRDNYGYRNLRSYPLLVSFLGVPYIDVRISFNSFIPKTLDDKIANKLVNYYLHKLKNNKNFHDKVEFRIVKSCYYFGIEQELKSLLEDGFSNDEIKKIEYSLLELTNEIINKENGLYRQDLDKIETLKDYYYDIVASNLSTIDKIYLLIQDCKKYGTLPFAGIARSAFIAMQFLNSMVIQNIISSNEKDMFLNSLNTVSKQLSKDLGNLDKDEFLSIYGHLRPGTYDIESPRYDENFDKYFSKGTTDTIDEIEFIFSDDKLNQIDDLLKSNNLKINAIEFIDFIKKSIENREYSKFIFTKSLSKVFVYIKSLGDRYNLEKSDLAHLDIQSILSLYASLNHMDLEDILKENIDYNKAQFDYTKAIKLPSIITNPEDIYSFYLYDDEPNYVTLNSIESTVIQEEDIENSDVSNKIVCIKSADPGYDYLFSKNISGLITCYGGANSHMAIRCAELNIPAVIGCGELLFNKYSKAKIILIDALIKQTKVIK